jgi:hypothetical protein
MLHLTIAAEGGLPHRKNFELIEDAEVVFVVVGRSFLADKRANNPGVDRLMGSELCGPQ